MLVRDVDKLDPMPDEKLRQLDEDYVIQHQLDKLLGGLMSDILKHKPQDPLQFIIDSITLGPEHAMQDVETGLPLHRREKLEQVFKIIDKDGSGKISLRMLQNYANKYGGETLTLDDLRGLFQDFKPASEHFINLKEFLRFFSEVSATITNKDFEAMIEEMSS
ncbi:hypothetical protein OEZ85_008447 [Tetradesmus obliquus]|uniref:EF-hand domain-containing protein n=1 Tax=Tetradesmus obliquus TaxID=3088 RepID=A0ABY8TNJ0_TETOB|nr:hypothetical protein OEZ85_008447 [Tetradesmus obliquus]